MARANFAYYYTYKNNIGCTITPNTETLNRCEVNHFVAAANSSVERLYLTHTTDMITTKKVFGSYVLTKVDYDKLASAGTKVDGESPCCIGSEWTPLQLLAIVPYNHDTSIFRFRLPDGQNRLRLPIGGFLLVLAPESEHDGSDAIRPYTSVQDDDLQCNSIPNSLLHENSNTDDNKCNAGEETGTFEMLCKRYDQWGIKESVQTHFLFTKTNHSYRPAGAVSNYLHKLKVGDCVKFKRKCSLSFFGFAPQC